MEVNVLAAFFVNPASAQVISQVIKKIVYSHENMYVMYSFGQTKEFYFRTQFREVC
jgi:hypothetical protein